MTKAFEKQDVTEMTEKTAVTHAVVGEDHAGSRLDRFLTRQYPGLPRTRLYRIVRKGEVRVNGKRAEIDTRLVLGDSVRLPPVRATAAEPAQGEPGAASSAPAAPREVGATPATPAAQAAPAAPRAAGTPAPAAVRRRVPDTLMQTVTGAIIHEDERLLVIDKPAGIAVHGGSGVSFGIIEALRAARPQESDSLELVHRLDNMAGEKVLKMYMLKIYMQCWCCVSLLAIWNG
jgi:23S rRNA pseudouridine955/2504/2580 synthase